MENYNIHFNEFATSGDVQAALDAGTLVKPYVALVGGEVDINGMDISPIDYSKMPLTFEITGDGDVIWKTAGYGSVIRTIEYKLNDGEWTSITSSTAGEIIQVIAGDIIQFRGDNTFYGGSSSAWCGFLGSTATFKVYGNIMSLLYSTGFETATTFPGDENTGPFARLFMSCSGLTDASNLIMPATTLKQNCYRSMFWSCTSLTNAPELPATALTSSCYYEMFSNCTSLTSAPELTATTLADNCYKGMFSYCTSLTSAPELTATTLADSCYEQMFYGCTSLTSAPELPATSLAGRSYFEMFNGCTNLNYVKCLATDISASLCLNNWVNGVSPTGTFVKNPNMSSWTTGDNGIPAGWTVVDA